MIQPTEKKQFHQAIFSWFDQHGRKDLPWQQQISPYRVWISEIMLQQTQVKTVIPYFNRFMHTFPSLSSLAAAELNHILEIWSGLGYYRRAHHLHAAAQHMMEHYAGIFPIQVEELMKLPGIGRSTAGAIVSLAMNQSSPVMDANIKRVFRRYFGFFTISTAQEKILWHTAETLSFTQRPRDYTQALMDLGALICTHKNPQCTVCPVQKKCHTHQNQAWKLFQSSPKKQKPIKTVTLLILHRSDHCILLQKRSNQGVWPSLWSLPELLSQNADPTSFQPPWCMLPMSIPDSVHTFSHFKLNMRFVIHYCNTIPDFIHWNDTLDWFPLQTIKKSAIPAPIKKILLEYGKQFYNETPV